MRDAFLHDETLATGIERALLRALSSGQGSLTLPKAHLSAAAAVLLATPDPESGPVPYCCLSNPNVYDDGRGRVTMCIQRDGHRGECKPTRLARPSARYRFDSTAKGWQHLLARPDTRIVAG